MDTLYFDGRCPLCRREMALLSRIKGASLRLVDVHQPGAVPPDSVADMLEVLHLQTAAGTWLTGVDATVRAWSHTPVGWLWGWLAWGPVRPMAERLYRRWARRRYARLYGCAVKTGRPS
ncbi:MAG: DUF393 domain-containing protein [Alcanivorax sp.]|nr:DUF393 domain-containing protein [Alcanivorax sp.]